MPRRDESNYVAWVPRSSNATADFLANIALQNKEDFVWTSDQIGISGKNLIVMSDGEFRNRTGALAWVILDASTHDVLHMQYRYLCEAQSSFQCELMAMDEAIATAYDTFFKYSKCARIR